jgi:hypothetical protein
MSCTTLQRLPLVRLPPEVADLAFSARRRSLSQRR